MPMGPIRLYDVVGLDVAAHAGKTMIEAFPDRVLDAPLTRSDGGCRPLGRKIGTRILQLRE